MTSFDYYDFRKKNAVAKINEEIAFYENCIYSKSYPVNQYLLYLRNRIGMDKIESATITHYDGAGNKKEIQKMNMDEYVKDMDIYIFSRPWIRLKEIHKTMKIKEFIEGLVYSKKLKESTIAKNKEYLKKEICLGVKTKKFGKHKSIIDYDEKNMNILSISCIDYNKKKRLYEIDWDI